MPTTPRLLDDSDRKPLRKVHAGSPLQTNASLNRKAAVKAFNAGMTVQQIADEWPEVFAIDAEGKLRQKYDYELADGSGRYETNRRITDASVQSAIRRLGRNRA